MKICEMTENGSVLCDLTRKVSVNNVSYHPYLQEKTRQTTRAKFVQYCARIRIKQQQVFQGFFCTILNFDLQIVHTKTILINKTTTIQKLFKYKNLKISSYHVSSGHLDIKKRSCSICLQRVFSMTTP